LAHYLYSNFNILLNEEILLLAPTEEPQVEEGESEFLLIPLNPSWIEIHSLKNIYPVVLTNALSFSIIL